MWGTTGSRSIVDTLENFLSNNPHALLEHTKGSAKARMVMSLGLVF